MSHLVRDCPKRYHHFSLFGLGANAWAKVHQFTKIGDNLLPVQLYHPAKFHWPASTHARDIRYKEFANKQRNSKRHISDVPVGMWK